MSVNTKKLARKVAVKVHMVIRMIVRGRNEKEARQHGEFYKKCLLRRYQFDYGDILEVHPFNSPEGQSVIKEAFNLQWNEFKEAYKVLKELLNTFTPKDLYYGRVISSKAKQVEVFEKIGNPEDRITTYLSYWTSYARDLVRDGISCWVWWEDCPLENEEELESILNCTPEKDKENLWVLKINLRY